MACGDIDWWRGPDRVGLLQRYGAAEHLVVQFDFVSQPRRDGRAEFSVPGASKSQNGQTGYADIVAVATREIWEIKPEHLEEKAAVEAAWYEKKAIISCGAKWRRGTSYETKNRRKTVYEIQGNGVKAQLVAVQGQPGTVLYSWEINGKKQEKLDPYYSIALRAAIVQAYFPSPQSAKPLPDAKSDDLPPVKWKPPVLQPGSLIPELGQIAAKIMKAIQYMCCQQIIDGGAVAILVEQDVYNQIVGPGIVARQISMLQVRKPDPTVTLYRKTLLALSALAVSHAAVAAAVGGAWIIKEAIMAGGAVVVESGFIGGAIKISEKVASSEMVTTFIDSLKTSARVQMAIGDGATMLVFAIPHPTVKDPNTPASIRPSFPLYTILTPSETQHTRLGQTLQAQGTEWVVVGLVGSAPD